MSLKTIIGQAARGNAYFPRPQITTQIWEKIETGSNILLVAPRRVGKSSILFYLLDNPREGFIVLYYTSESVNNENEFYKKLYHHIVDELSRSQRFKAKVQTISKELFSRIESVNTNGISLGESKILYLDELHKLIKNLKIGDERIIVLIDEFAQTVENIIQDEDEKAAIHFLESKREIRQAPGIFKKLQCIYAGSIGLENIVSRINGINLINDLISITVSPLKEAEAQSLTNKILNDSGITIDDESFDYMIKTIGWLIPYYIQIILDEASNILTEKSLNIITKDTIDASIQCALKKRIYFEHWFSRLRKAYHGAEFSFVKELLNKLSEEGTLNSAVIVDLSVKYSLETSYNDLVNALKYDGYMNNNDEPKIYRFNSPLLREWWNRNVAN